jgi:hypothetical protein
MKTAKELGITQQQFNNLFKLAYYLLEGKLKAAFDMKSFDSNENLYWSDYCGTIGCAVGHGPYAGIPKRKVGWRAYCEESFGVSADILAGWWLFSFKWTDIDNTPRGAGQRILYFLKYGKPKSVNDFNPKLYSGMRLVRKSHSTH